MEYVSKLVRQSEVKDEVVPLHSMKAYGGVGVQHHS